MVVPIIVPLLVMVVEPVEKAWPSNSTGSAALVSTVTPLSTVSVSLFDIPI